MSASNYSSESYLGPVVYPPWEDAATYVFFALLYGVAAVWMLTQSVLLSQVEKRAEKKVAKFWHWISALGLSVRCVIYGIQAMKDDTVTLFILRRLNLAFFFTAFALLAFHWIAYNFTSDNRGRTFKITSIVFAVSNGVFYIFQIVVIAIYYSPNVAPELAASIYNADIYLDACVSMFISVLCAFFGIGLYFRLKQAVVQLAGTNALRHVGVLKIIGQAVFLVICLSFRFAMYLYRPLTGLFLPEYIFQTCAYAVPEVAPSLLFMWIFRPQYRSVRARNASGNHGSFLLQSYDGPSDLSFLSQKQQPSLTITYGMGS